MARGLHQSAATFPSFSLEDRLAVALTEDGGLPSSRAKFARTHSRDRRAVRQCLSRWNARVCPGAEGGSRGVSPAPHAPLTRPHTTKERRRDHGGRAERTALKRTVSAPGALSTYARDFSRTSRNDRARSSLRAATARLLRGMSSRLLAPLGTGGHAARLREVALRLRPPCLPAASPAGTLGGADAFADLAASLRRRKRAEMPAVGVPWHRLSPRGSQHPAPTPPASAALWGGSLLRRLSAARSRQCPPPGAPTLDERLSDCRRWNAFDVFAVFALSRGRPLTAVTLFALEDLDIIEGLKVRPLLPSPPTRTQYTHTHASFLGFPANAFLSCALSLFSYDGACTPF